LPVPQIAWPFADRDIHALYQAQVDTNGQSHAFPLFINNLNAHIREDAVDDELIREPVRCRKSRWITDLACSAPGMCYSGPPILNSFNLSWYPTRLRILHRERLEGSVWSRAFTRIPWRAAWAAALRPSGC